MATLYTLCGLPGCGKSTFANHNDNCIVVSSDLIRKELYGDENIQGNPKEVFDLVYKRIGEYLNENKTVILDATNLSKKNRQNIIHRFPTAEHICVVFNTPVEECINRNNQRERKVPISVIRRMSVQYEPPTLEEGFKEIIIKD